MLTAVLGPTQLRSRSVRCRLDESYAGFNVSGWTQVCTLRSVELYPTATGYRDLSHRLSVAARRSSNDWLARAPKHPPAHGCGILRSRPIETRNGLETRVTRLSANRFATAAPDDPCAPPAIDAIGGVQRVDPTYDEALVRSDQSWVSVVHQTEFLRRELGCARLLCDSPVRQAVLP